MIFLLAAIQLMVGLYILLTEIANPASLPGERSDYNYALLPDHFEELCVLFYLHQPGKNTGLHHLTDE